MLHLAKDKLKDCLSNQIDAVLDAANLCSDFRKIICYFGRDYKTLAALVVFLLPESIILKDNKNRYYSVRDEVLSKQLYANQFSLADEAHQLCVIGEKGQLLHRSGFISTRVDQ